MACTLMVLAVRYFPGEVGDKERRMQQPARGVVQRFGRRERLVATFVSDDPKASAEKALQESINDPKTESKPW